VTCDPSIISKESNNNEKDKFIVNVDWKRSTVICPEGFDLEYKKGSTYMRVDSIVCRKDTDKY
ncbi:hypothetical protein PFISCL1PPCAC_9114, partial [Pristionchus fissidentatus]